MIKYIKVPLETITRRPGTDTSGYQLIKNKYWPVDKDNNLFLTKRHHAICGTTRQTVRFYIERLELPVKPYYHKGRGKRHYPMVHLSTVWLKKRFYVSRSRLPV